MLISEEKRRPGLRSSPPHFAIYMLFAVDGWLSAVPVQAQFVYILMLAMPVALYSLEFFLNLLVSSSTE